MNILCKLNFHKWNNCICINCGKSRDENHNFRPVENKCIQICSYCHKEIPSEHKWEGCKCINCGETRNTGHEWDKTTHKCRKCDCNKYVKYVIVTVNGTGYIDDISVSLIKKFDEINKTNDFYIKQDELQDDNGKLIYYGCFKLVKNNICGDSGIDIINNPIEYISKVTGIDKSTIWNQNNQKLFMTKGTANITRNHSNRNINYSVTKYYYERN
jgi:hypothetical protein